MSAATFTCPSCASENTQRLSLAHSAGTLSSMGGGVGLSLSRSGVGVAGGAGRSTGTTDLAKELAPPPPFEKFAYWRSGCLSVLVAGAVGIGVQFVGFTLSPDGQEYLIFGVAGGVMLLLWLGHLAARRDYEAKRPEALARWEHSFICLRCAHVWEAGAAQVAEATASQKTCEGCGTPAPSHARFCTSCGSPLT